MESDKVYAVLGGFSNEGEDFDSLRLFEVESDAAAYGQHLINDEGYGYYVLGARSVNKAAGS
jgi:hypothetical protein